MRFFFAGITASTFNEATYFKRSSESYPLSARTAPSAGGCSRSGVSESKDFRSEIPDSGTATTRSSSGSAYGQSPARPGVRAISNGMPRASHRQRGFSWRSLLGCARALRRLDPFFPACGVLVGPVGRGIEHDPVEVSLLKGLEDCLPTTLLRPTVEALIHCVGLTEALREVFPGSPGAGNPEHRVQKPAVVIGVAARTQRFARKQRLKAIVLLVGQFIASSHERKFEDWCQTGWKRPVDAGCWTKMPLL